MILDSKTNGLIRYPNTGLEFRKVCGVSGAKDVVDYNYNSQYLRMSPNGKFLLYFGYVIPTGDGEIIKLVDFPANRSLWSPDGKKIAFYSNGIWVIPVSPETGRPIGPAKELLDGNYMYQQGFTGWSPDSEKIGFVSTDRYLSDLSINDGKVTKYTDKGEGHGPKGWSPDGRWRFYKSGNEKGIWLISTEGGEPRKLADKKGGSANGWSPDGKWVFYQEGQKLHFIRISDSYAFTVGLPKEIGNYVSWSPDGKRMLFYRCSYVWTDSLRIVPSSGGEPFGPRTIVLSSMVQHWSPDSRFVLTWGKHNDKDVYWVIPLTGDDPFPLRLDVALQGKLWPEILSPGANRLLFGRYTTGEQMQYWVTPTSLRQSKTVGRPIKIFDKGKIDRIDWSLDGSKLVFLYEEDLWMARTDGTAPVQLTGTSNRRVVRRAWSVDGSAWSPDGSTIAWISYYPASGQSILRMRRLYEDKSRVIAQSLKYICFKWSPYGNHIAYEFFDRKQGTTNELFVVSVPDGIPKRLIESSKGSGLSRNWAWSPNGEKLAILADDKLMVFQMPNGDAQQVGKLLDPSWGTCFDMEWSPDGREIAMIIPMKPDSSDEQNTRIFTVTVPEGKWTELAGKSGTNYYLYWSPDGKWISYDSEEFVKIRPEGILWE
ncbi:MAG: PD40 domain-containing protein, partial [Candidatus Aminicenantes bacterium]|nr:PD40 domain-containing protein [Candidatus Aminicenantes bacterium]